jgi:hypothetical protein
VRRRGRPRNHLALSRSRSRVHLGPGANNSPFVTNLIATRSEQTHDVSISVRRLRAAGLRIKQWSRRGEAVHLSRALLNLSRRSLLIIPAERRYFSKPSSPRHAIPTLLGVSLRGLITFLERWSRLLLRKLIKPSRAPLDKRISIEAEAPPPPPPPPPPRPPINRQRRTVELYGDKRPKSG